MKKLFSLVIALMAMTASSQAQNVQLHYDLGHSLCGDLSSRQSVTTTVEMFKPDNLGSTFLFTDIYYKEDGVTGSYWEIAREFDITKNKQWAAHIEYNGGVGTLEKEKAYSGIRFQHSVLLGGAWNWHSKDFSKVFSAQLMYKYNFTNHHTGERPFSGFQLTEVWSTTFAHGLCTFDGFCDLWYDPKVNGKLVLVSQPQFWFNLNRIKGWSNINLSVGTEWEISNNFIQNNKFYAIPTIATKWTF
jgi:hypothetical protein